MDNVSDLFSSLGGPASVARILNVGPSTASEMKRRGSIPVEHWPAIVKHAQIAKVRGVTYDALVQMHARKRGAA